MKKEREQHQQEGGAAGAAAAFGSEVDPSDAAAGGALDGSPGAGEAPGAADAAAPPEASAGKHEDGSAPFCIELANLE